MLHLGRVQENDSACRRSRRNAMDLIYSATKKRALPSSSGNLPLSFLDSINDGAELKRAEPPAGVASALFDYQLQALRFRLDSTVCSGQRWHELHGSSRIRVD